MTKQIVKGIRKFVPVFQEAKEKDINKDDIVTHINKFLEEALGYDIIGDVTKESQRYIDLTIKIDNKVKFYIEVKSANTKLEESHVYQAERYALQSGVPWVILTNGSEWQVYHLVFDKTIGHSLISSIDLINGDIEQNAEKLYCLSRDAMSRNEIDGRDKHITLSGESNINEKKEKRKLQKEFFEKTVGLSPPELDELKRKLIDMGVAKELEVGDKCPNCGRWFKEKTLICPYCGQDISSPTLIDDIIAE